MYNEDMHLMEFSSIFLENVSDDKIKDYKEQVKILEGMKKDGTPEKIFNALSIYFRIVQWANIFTCIICPPLLLSALIDKLLADWLQDKSKHGKMAKLQKQIDKDISIMNKELRKQQDPAVIKKLKANIKTLEELSNKL